MNKKPAAYIVQEYVLITVGAACMALGDVLFSVPAKLVGGGLSGIAIMLHWAMGWDVGITTLLLCLPLFAIGIKVFGKEYGWRSLIGTVIYTSFLTFFGQLWQYRPVLDLSGDSAILLSALAAGVLAGVGVGLVFRGGSNTGGTDLAAQLVAKITPLTPGQALFLIDGTIIAVSGLQFGLPSALSGAILAYISSYCADRVNMGLRVGLDKTVFIISEHPDKIRSAVLSLGHTGTLITSSGLYTGEPKPCILVVIPNKELTLLVRLVSEADSRAFVIVNESYRVLGEGFDSIEAAAWGK